MLRNTNIFHTDFKKLHKAVRVCLYYYNILLLAIICIAACIKNLTSLESTANSKIFLVLEFH